MTISTIPMGRITEPDYIADLAHFLGFGSGGYYINGQNISADGGVTA
ncbi:hypothetical protein SB861_25275 [Paraburkholderia sp. SIMBA_049]